MRRSRGRRAARAYLLLHGKYAGHIVRKGLIQHIYHYSTAYPVIERFLTKISVSKLGVVALKISTVAERNIFFRFRF